jgi:hypothetical protein
VSRGEEPKGGTPEWDKEWEKREEKARELLHGKKRGDRAVVQRSDGEVETDWIIGRYTEDDKGEGRVFVTRGKGKKVTRFKNIKEEEFWKNNFEGSEEIVDKLKGNIDHVRSFALTEYNREDVDQRTKEANDMLRDFMNGDFRSTRDYYKKELDERIKDKETAKRLFEKAAKALNEVRDRISEAGIEDVSDLKDDLRDAERSFSERSKDFQRVSSEAEKLSKKVQALDKKIEESK